MGTGSWLLSVIVKVLPVGTVISGGCQLVARPAVWVWACPFVCVQVVVPVPCVIAPHDQPHIGTMLPSGIVVLVRDAVD